MSDRGAHGKAKKKKLEFVDILLEMWSTIIYRAILLLFLIVIEIVSTMRNIVNALTK